MPRTVKEKIESAINRSSDKAFIRRELDRYGSYRQVSRAISDLVDEGKLMRGGLGILVKARQAKSPFKRNFGETMTYPVTDAVGVALEVLPKLGYRARVGSLDEDRLTGKSTQMPIKGIVRVDRRVRREINVNGEVIEYEKNRPRP